MASWQYAWLTDQPYTTIGFSHPQPGLAAELAGILGAGVLTAQSSEWSISLDRSRVNLGYVSGLLGDRGWEMFSVETRTQPQAVMPSQLQTNWYFKRQGPDRAAAAVVATAPAMAATPAAPAAPAMGAAMGEPAPTVVTPQQQMAPAATAAPEMQAAPAMPAAPEMAPAMPVAQEMAPAMPAAPAAPAGPEQAPYGTAPTPPPGPQG